MSVKRPKGRRHRIDFAAMNEGLGHGTTAAFQPHPRAGRDTLVAAASTAETQSPRSSTPPLSWPWSCPFLSPRPQRPDPLLHPRARLQGRRKREGLPCILRCRNATIMQVGLLDWTCRTVCVKVKGYECGQAWSRPSHDQEVPNKGRLAPRQPLEEEVQGKAHPPLLFSQPAKQQPTSWRPWLA